MEGSDEQKWSRKRKPKSKSGGKEEGQQHRQGQSGEPHSSQASAKVFRLIEEHPEPEQQQPQSSKHKQKQKHKHKHKQEQELEHETGAWGQPGPSQKQETGPWGRPESFPSLSKGHKQPQPQKQETGPWGKPQSLPSPSKGHKQETGPWGKPQSLPSPSKEQKQETGPWGKPQSLPSPSKGYPGPSQKQETGPWGKPESFPGPSKGHKQETGPWGKPESFPGPSKGYPGPSQKQETGPWGKPQSLPSPSKGQKQESGAWGKPRSFPSPSKVDVITSTMGSTKLSEGLRVRPMNVVPARIDKRGPKTGARLSVEVNHFPIKMSNPNLIAFQYDVLITPDKPKKFLRTVWNVYWKRNFPDRSPSFDGSKIAVSAGPLMQRDYHTDSFELEVDNNKKKEYKVEVTLASKVNLKNLYEFLSNKKVAYEIPSAELAVLDIALRNNAANSLVRAGRNFFTKPGGQIISLGEGLEVWYGYYQSAVLGWKLYLNFDVAHKGFPISDMLRAVEEVCFTRMGRTTMKIDDRTILDRQAIDKLDKFLKNLKVEYKLPNEPGSKRVYRVNGVRPDPACKEYFSLEQGDKKVEKIDVVRYYRTQRNYNVKYPNLPALWVGSLKSKIYVPMELCTIIPGQVTNRKLTSTQTSKLIRVAADPPPVRKRKILDKLENSEFKNRFTNEFGISVASELEKVEARVLDPPQLKSQRVIEVRRGQWDLNKFLQAMPLKDWCILNLAPDRIEPNLQMSLEKSIVDQARKMGMDAQRPVQHCVSCNPKQYHRVVEIFNDFKRKNVRLVFVIVPEIGNFYHSVKKISEIEVGVLTQCLKSSTVYNLFGERANLSTLSNILLKVNAKLNGVNHSLHEMSLPPCLHKMTMIVGADVTHPSPDAVNIPSIAAVAASYDATAMKYHTIRRVQTSKCEVIEDFENIMKELLLYFYRRTRYKPERIIMFRDGVSEGQVDKILKDELMALRRACSAMQAPDNRDDYQPPITFIIVQKNHHTRFFPLAHDRSFNERNPNVPPGTCVDSEVVHPRDLDFYLVSHASRLGTARPTKYKLIYDDSTMTEEELQKLAFYLCHLLSRCNKSISYPAPTYYAHLAALRARIHLLADQQDGGKPVENMDNKIKVCDYFNQNPMFFV